MTFLASDVFDGARSPFLNDVNANLYTNAVLLPHLKAANEELEKLMIIHDIPVQRVLSSVIPITAGQVSITVGGNPALPADFLIPSRIWERTTGDSDYSWSEVLPLPTEQQNRTPTTTFDFYSFRNNGLYFIAATTNRDIKLDYERQLAVISGDNSPIDNYLIKQFLVVKVAEFAARYTGQNKAYADDLAAREVEPKKEDLERIFTLQGQNIRGRRPPFTIKPGYVYGRR